MLAGYDISLPLEDCVFDSYSVSADDVRAVLVSDR